MRISDWSSDVCSSDFSLSVAENPAEPEARRIELNIAWLPADEDGDLQPDPVFLLAGGPGQSETASYPAVASAFKDVRNQRGVVLVDQRGTGKSNPLQCEGLADEDMPADEAAMLEAMRKAVERWRDELSQRADLHFYTDRKSTRLNSSH